jgi:signal transduction histidine kinase
MSKTPRLPFAQRAKNRFIFIYSIIGFSTTLGLLLYLLVTGVGDNRPFLIAVIVANVFLALTFYFSSKKNTHYAANFALVTVMMGCIGSLNLQFPAFLSLIMIFVLSAVFVTVKRWQIIVAYSSIVVVASLKLMAEWNLLQSAVFKSFGISSDSLFFISAFLLSIFAYSAIINLLVNRGLENSAKLEDTLRLKELFLMTISHDLKSPMGSISTMVNALFKNSRSTDEEILRLLKDTTDSTIDLLNDLLIWSKLDGNTYEVKAEIVSLDALVQEAVIAQKPGADIKNITLDYVPGDNVVFCDKSMISAVIRNLISNAIKFSFENGTITIESKEFADHIRLSVRDEGVGISPENQQQLFVTGAGKSRTGTANESGTGIGLVIAHDFTIANGGTIGVDSAKGKGSTFWLEIPRHAG